MSRLLVAASALLGALSPSLAQAGFGGDPISPNPSRANYSDVRNLLHNLAASSGGKARVVTLLAPAGSDPIEALAVGSGPVKNLVVATHHGNEYGSTEVARALAASLAEAPLPGQTVYVVPVLNISGYNSKSREEKGSDPNRDYPGPCGGEGPHNLASTRALAEFIDREQIVTSATLHTYSPAVVWPWGFSTPDLSTPYDGLYKQLAEAAVLESGYEIGNSAEAIYPANGTYEDYAFWKHGTWSLLFELGRSHSPTRSQIVEMARVNVSGLRRYLEAAPRERAADHAFRGRCDSLHLLLDRHDE